MTAIHTAASPEINATDRILAAAAVLFSEQGYDAASVSAIAERAGISKANVFHHFSSKNELYIAVLQAACRDTERIQAFTHDTGPFFERLSNFAAAQLANMLEQSGVSRLILRELLKGGETHGRELAEKVFGDNFARLVDILRLGQRDGELRSDLDPAMVATLLVGANVFFFESQEVLRHFPDVQFAHEPSRYSGMLVDILLRGIAAPDMNKPTTTSV